MFRIRKKNAGIVTLLLLFGMTVPAFASGTSNKIVEDPVLVTATKTEKKLLDVQYSVDVITADEINKKAAVQFQDLLKNIPGVQIANRGRAESNRISIRGEQNKSTLVLIDGVKVSTVFHGHGSDLTIDPSTIERIEVIKGPGTVLYGSEALGGVVNVITRKGGEKPFQGDFRSAYMGSTHAWVNSGSIYGKVNDMSYRLSGSYGDFSSIEYYHTKGDDTGRVLYSLAGNLGYDFTDKINMGIGYEYNNQKTEAGNTLGEESRKEVNKINANITIKDLNGMLSRIRADVYYYGNDHGYDSSKKDNIVKHVTDANIANYGLNLQSDWSFGNFTYMVAGYEWLHEELDYKRRFNTGLTIGSKKRPPFSTYPANTYRIRDAEQDTHALYVSVDHVLPRDFTLNYGVRLIHFNTGVNDAHYYLPDGTMLYYNGKPYGIGANDGSESKAVFSTSLVWSGIDHLAIRALWSQGFRPPSFYYKYLDIPMGHGGFIHNPDLKPEFSNNFELGARYDYNGITADIVGFYTLTDDRISYKRIMHNGKRANSWENRYESTAYGLEFQLAYEFSGIEPYVTGTWIDREEKYDTGKEAPQEAPSLYGRFGVRYNNTIANGIKFNADLNAEYENSYDYSTWKGEKKSADSFTTLNLSFGFDWKKYYAQFELKNIFDKKYNYHTNSKPEPGVNGNIVLGVHF